MLSPIFCIIKRTFDDTPYRKGRNPMETFNKEASLRRLETLKAELEQLERIKRIKISEMDEDIERAKAKIAGLKSYIFVNTKP